MVDCVLLAAGSGKRFGMKKQFLKIGGKRIVDHSLDKIQRIQEVNRVFVVLQKEDMDIEINISKPVIKVEGGKERQDSVFNALNAIGKGEIVVIHDAARPFATVEMFRDAIENVKNGCDGSITAYKSVDTVKRVKDGVVSETLNREEVYIVQTPQAFNFEKLLKAHRYAREKGILGTDDAYLMEVLGFKVCVNQGAFFNFKITTPDDLKMLNLLGNV